MAAGLHGARGQRRWSKSGGVRHVDSSAARDTEVSRDACSTWARLRGWLAAAAIASVSGTTLADARSGASCPPPPAPPGIEQVRAAQDNARDHGLLWRLSKGGHDSYLFGTIHVGKLQWSFPGPTLSRVLGRTDTLALELDLGDPAMARQLQSATSGSDAPAVPAALRQRLDAQIAASCLPADALQALHPVLQVLTLTLLAARADALDAAYAQELMLAAQARAAGREIVSLESVEQQLRLLLPTDALEVQTMVDEALDQLERGLARPTLRRLAQAWADGDLAMLEQYARWCGCADTEAQRALLRRLNDERNANLARGIDALHAQGRSVFAAVGALHMTGPQALPKLLAQRGYAVQRVPLR